MADTSPETGNRKLLETVHKLRPAKIRNALRRRWFEWQLSRRPLHAASSVVHLGSSYGGWKIPDLVQPSWVCYCVGAGGDVSFDLELVKRYGATARAFDPVPDYVRRAIEDGAGEPRFSAHQVAIAAADGPIRLQVTHDPQSQSVSPAGLYESQDFIEAPGRTLSSLMAEMGDERIDLLKLDIEGGEYSLLPQLDLPSLGVKIFAVQLHHTGTVREARGLLRELREEGYELVACRKSVKLTFARRELL
jgi:FkbM family methyltransferase